MKSVTERMLLRQETKDDDEVSSDVSSKREGAVFTDSEFGESLNEQSTNERCAPTEKSKQAPSAPVNSSNTSTSPSCNGLCWLQKTEIQDDWTGSSKLLVIDRRLPQKGKYTKNKRKPVLTKKRCRKVTVGVQTSPEDFEKLNPLPSVDPDLQSSEPGGVLNPLETTVDEGDLINGNSHGSLLASRRIPESEDVSIPTLNTTTASLAASASASGSGSANANANASLNPYAKPYVPQLPYPNHQN